MENNKNWTLWLQEKETELKSKGYRKYNEHLRNQDFTYCRNFDGYVVLQHFYDFTKHNGDISIMFECMLLHGDRIDLTVSKDMTTEEFEEMAEEFYLNFKKYL